MKMLPLNNNKPAKRRAGLFPNSGAFTVSELLVALGITIVLASMMMVQYQKWRGGSQSLQCINNLRQISALFNAFAADHGGVLNFQYHTHYAGSTVAWNNYLINGGYLSRDNTFSACPTHFVKYTGEYPYSARDGGHIYGGMGLVEPGDPHSSMIDNIPSTRAIRLYTIEEPSKYWLLADSWSSQYEAQIYYLSSNTDSTAIHLRHQGKANMLFADGHVEAVDLDDTKKFKINPQRAAFDAEGRKIYR